MKAVSVKVKDVADFQVFGNESRCWRVGMGQS